MKKIKIFPFLMMKFLSTILVVNTIMADDVYSNFEDLKSHYKEGVDFKITAIDRKSSILILAIHGGWIEKGSDILAEEIAGKDANLYLFRAIMSTNNRDLHITSANFDEPRALELTEKSENCLSIHGFLEEKADVICIGGLNKQKAESMASYLRSLDLGFSVEFPCKRFEGTAVKNIVNRCKNKGVQLEISTHFRKILIEDPVLRSSIVKTIRSSIE